MKVEIDDRAGFCSGVKRTIKVSEKELGEGKKLYCLGEIVHNQKEVERLTSEGLIFIDNEEFKKLKNVRVLIRAHGEPPETYRIAEENNIELIDTSCKVVLNLQNQIKKAYKEMKKCNGQILLFGQSNHPEIVGLAGQTNNEAIIIKSVDDLSMIDFKKPIRLFTQTTKSVHDYLKLVAVIRGEIESLNQKEEYNFKYKNSICHQVSNREDKLIDFARKHDVVVFVAGKNSSNGKFLYDVCKSNNAYTYLVSSSDEIKKVWFDKGAFVGVSGATSTPLWLMEEVAKKIESIRYVSK